MLPLGSMVFRVCSSPGLCRSYYDFAMGASSVQRKGAAESRHTACLVIFCPNTASDLSVHAMQVQMRDWWDIQLEEPSQDIAPLTASQELAFNKMAGWTEADLAASQAPKEEEATSRPAASRVCKGLLETSLSATVLL